MVLVKGSAEFKLAVGCCRANFRGEAPADDRIEADWGRFVDLIGFHRIEGLAWKALSANSSAAPEAVVARLSDAAKAIAARNLQAAADCHALLDRFDAAGVPLLFLKGLTLGALAYGNPAIKSAIDLDLLIDPTDLGRAAELLRAAGYELAAPRNSPADRVLHAWHRGWKESVWSKSAPGLQLDLHTRTADNPRLIPRIDVHAQRQSVHLGSGIRVPTLADDELFAYLTVHGASSAWFRLKWVSDFAAFLHNRPDIDRLYERSQELGAGRAAGQALLLADELFGTLEASPELRRQLGRDRVTRRLFEIALRLLTKAPIEPTQQRLGTLAIHRTQFLLLPGLPYKVSEVARQASRLLAWPRS